MGIKRDFNEWLKEALRIAGTKTALAKALKVRNQTISSWELGCSPRLDNMEKLISYVERKGGSKNNRLA